MKKEIGIALLLLGLLIAGFVGGFATATYFDITPKNFDGAAVKKEGKVPSDFSKKLISYDKAMKSDKPALVMFYVDWCGYCKRFAPLMPELKKKYKKDLNMVMVNCEDTNNAEIVQKYDIKGYPSIFIVDPATGTSEYIEAQNYYPIANISKYIDGYLKK